MQLIAGFFNLTNCICETRFFVSCMVPWQFRDTAVKKGASTTVLSVIFRGFPLSLQTSAEPAITSSKPLTMHQSR